MTTFAVLCAAETTPPIGSFRFPVLQGVKNDLEVASDLWRADYTRTLPNVTRSQLDSAVRDYQGIAQDGDSLVLFFSGHGYQEPDPDSAEPDMQREALGCSDGLYFDVYLSRLLHGFDPGVHVFAVLDACHAEGITFAPLVAPHYEPLPWSRRVSPTAAGTVFTIGASHESAQALQREASDGEVYGQLSLTIREVASEIQSMTWRQLWGEVSIRSQYKWGASSLPAAHLSGPNDMNEGLIDELAFA